MHRRVVKRHILDHRRRNKPRLDIDSPAKDDRALRLVDVALDARGVRLGHDARERVRLRGVLREERLVPLNAR